jgi:hypothetical protein
LFFAAPPATASAAALVMVMANSISGSIGYLRDRRVDLKLAGYVALGGIPTSIAGALAVRHVSAPWFDGAYGLVLVYLSIQLARRARTDDTAAFARRGVGSERVLVDARGDVFRYRQNAPLAVLCGLGVGFISSFFGVGGGIIFVGAILPLFEVPAHVLAATSTFTILLTSPPGVVAHALGGAIDWAYALPLALGGLAGGQLGPRAARALSSPQLFMALAVLLFSAALLLALRHLVHQ